MLCVKNYPQKYIDECRRKVDAQLSTYKKLVAASRKQSMVNDKLLNAAIESFEPVFFNNMVLVLDHYFLHRSREMERKDGNPMNEVRILFNSIMTNYNKMFPDKTIKYDAAKSVLKYKAGDEIKLRETDFIQLSKAFLLK